MAGVSRKRKRGEDEDNSNQQNSAKIAVSAKHLDRVGPALGTHPHAHLRPFSDFVNPVAFPAVKPPPASVFHAFTRNDQQQEGNNDFATAQTLIAAETETVEFMSTNQDKDTNNIDYSCQYAP
jgi:hypothetical protein